jgi:hypothetical protein
VPSGRAPRRYGFPFLYEKIIACGRNGKTCNEARMSYGCGSAGSRSDFQGIPSKRLSEMRNSLKPRSRYEWHSRLARILGRIAAWSGRPAGRPRHRVDRAVSMLSFFIILLIVSYCYFYFLINCEPALQAYFSFILCILHSLFYMRRCASQYLNLDR